jgi:hypothetical protein
MDVEGAVLLTSSDAGTVQVYGPGGMPAGTVSIEGGALVFSDMWGRETGSAKLPLPDVPGLIAGDVPEGAYLYRTRSEGCTRVVYTWGWLCVDDGNMPVRMHVWGARPLDVEIYPSPGVIGMEVRCGGDVLIVSLEGIRGGRWAPH